MFQYIRFSYHFNWVEKLKERLNWREKNILILSISLSNIYIWLRSNFLPHTFSTFCQVESISRSRVRDRIYFNILLFFFLYLIPSTIKEPKKKKHHKHIQTATNSKEKKQQHRKQTKRKCAHMEHTVLERRMYYAWESVRNSHQSIKYIHIIRGLCVLQMPQT